MNRKTTKRALGLSFVSLLLCFTMLMGTTFAWFTDNASVKVNTIQAGTLDIDLVDKEGNSLKGETIGFVDESTEANKISEILWEPGCRYLLEEVTLVNKGNLWAKCKLVITAVNGTNDGDIDLASVIDVYEGDSDKPIGTLRQILDRADAVKDNIVLAPSGAEDGSDKASFGQIKLVMQETAGNDYQGKSLNSIAVTVLATQATAESDSFNNQYDAGAQYPNQWSGTVGEVPAPSDDPTTEDVVEQNVIIINTGEELAGLAASVNAGNSYAGYTVKLGKDIDLNNKEWTSIGLTKDTAFAGAFDGQGHTISNLYMSKSSRADGYYAGLFANSKMPEMKNLTIHNANVSGGNMSAILIGIQRTAIDISNVKFTGDVCLKITNYEGGLVVANGPVKSISDVTVDVSDNSYVKCLTTNTSKWEYLGGVWGHVWPTTATNISSNIDVYGYASSVGGIGGGCAVNSENIVCEGDVTIAIDDTEKDSGYDCSMRNALIYGFGVGSANAATHKNCSATGKLTVNGSVITSLETTDDHNTADPLWTNGYQKNDVRFGAPYYAAGVITIED